LKLFKFQEVDVPLCSQFFTDLNALPLSKLKHLTLEFTERQTLSFCQEEIHLPLLRQLESFHFWASNGLQLNESLERFAIPKDGPLRWLTLCKANYDNARLLYSGEWRPLTGRCSILQVN